MLIHRQAFGGTGLPPAAGPHNPITPVKGGKGSIENLGFLGSRYPLTGVLGLRGPAAGGRPVPQTLDGELALASHWVVMPNTGDIL